MIIKKKSRIDSFEVVISETSEIEQIASGAELTSEELNNLANQITDLIEDDRIYSVCIKLSNQVLEILHRRIILEQQFNDIARAVGLSQKKTEATYYNAIRKIRKEVGRLR